MNPSLAAGGEWNPGAWAWVFAVWAPTVAPATAGMAVAGALARVSRREAGISPSLGSWDQSERG
jgi:hypothetical protein